MYVFYLALCSCNSEYSTRRQISHHTQFLHNAIMRILTVALALLGLAVAQDDGGMDAPLDNSTFPSYAIMPAMVNASTTSSTAPTTTGAIATLTYLRVGTKSASLGYVGSVVSACKGHTTIALQCVVDAVSTGKNQTDTLCPGTGGPVSRLFLSP